LFFMLCHDFFAPQYIEVLLYYAAQKNESDLL